MLPPDCTGTRNGSAASAAHAQHRRAGARTARPARAIAARPTRGRDQRQRAAVAHGLQLRRVPDLAHQQHRRQHERAEHRPRAPAHRAARARRPRRAPPRPPCRRSAPRPGRPAVSLIASDRILGRTPRRMSTMLRVTWPRWGLPSRCGHSGSPTRMTVPLPSLTARQRRAQLTWRLAGRRALGLLLGRSAAGRRPPAALGPLDERRTPRAP